MFSFSPTPRYAVAGVRRVLVGSFAAGTRFVFGALLATGLAPDLLTTMVPAATWYRLTATDAATAIQSGTATLTGERHEQRLTLPFVTCLSRLQRYALTALLRERRVWALFEDQTGNWWLAGKSRGLHCKGLAFTPGPRNGEMVATATLEGTEPEAWHPYSSAAALALYSATTALEDDFGVPITELPPVE